MFEEFFADGSILAMGSGTVVGTAGTWTSLGCLMNATPPRLVKSFTEVRACLNNPSKKKKKRPGQVDYGNFSATLRYDADQYDVVKDALEGDTTKPLALILGDTGRALKATVWVGELGIPQFSEETDEILMEVSFEVDDAFEEVAAGTITIAS